MLTRRSPPELACSTRSPQPRFPTRPSPAGVAQRQEQAPLPPWPCASRHPGPAGGRWRRFPSRDCTEIAAGTSLECVHRRGAAVFGGWEGWDVGSWMSLGHTQRLARGHERDGSTLPSQLLVSDAEGRTWSWEGTRGNSDDPFTENSAVFGAPHLLLLMGFSRGRSPSHSAVDGAVTRGHNAGRCFRLH